MIYGRVFGALGKSHKVKQSWLDSLAYAIGFESTHHFKSAYFLVNGIGLLLTFVLLDSSSLDYAAYAICFLPTIGALLLSGIIISLPMYADKQQTTTLTLSLVCNLIYVLCLINIPAGSLGPPLFVYIYFNVFGLIGQARRSTLSIYFGVTLLAELVLYITLFQHLSTIPDGVQGWLPGILISIILIKTISYIATLALTKAKFMLIRAKSTMNSLFEQSQAGHMLLESDLQTYIFGNEQFFKIIQKAVRVPKPEEVESIVLELISPHYTIKQLCEELEKISQLFLTKQLIINGQTRYFRLQITCLNVDNHINYWLRLSDVTESELSRINLLKTERALNQAQEIAKIGFAESNILLGKVKLGGWIAKLFGIEEGTWISLETMFSRIDPEGQVLLQSKMHKSYFDVERPQSDYFKILDIDGNLRSMQSWSVTEYDAETGNLTYGYSTIQDITEKELQLQVLHLAKQQAEIATKAKTQFLSNMSHEIRTPLNAVVGITNILMVENNHNGQQQTLQALKTSADQLLELVNEILDFNKLDAGKAQLDLQEFDLRLLLGNLNNVYKVRAKEKALRFEITSPFSINHYIIADKGKLTQILNNLVGNAIKFTMQGYVKVLCQIKQTASDEHISLFFTIVDTGIGIPKEQQEQLFEAFYQSRYSTERQMGGTGLGLAISKGLVELMGGSIHMESNPGAGSQFFVEIPVQVGKPLVDAASVDGLADDLLEQYDGLKVLVVDDNKLNQMVVCRIMERWGVETAVVDDGTEALQAVLDFEPHLVLMDLQMPEMDGYQATAQIREHADALSMVPIIALTASASIEVQRRVRASGFNDYLAKPFKPKLLNELLGTYLPVSFNKTESDNPIV